MSVDSKAVALPGSSSPGGSVIAGRLHLLLTLVAALVVIHLAFEEDLSWLLAFFVLATLSVVSAIRWPYGALIVLIALSAMPVFFVQISGWKARPEHFAAAIVLAAVILARVIFKKQVRFDPLDAWIGAFVLMNFFSSAIASSAPASTLRWAIQNSLAVGAYFLLRALVTDLTRLKICFRILLGVGLLECLYGIGCWISHALFETNVGVQIGQYFGVVAAPYGSMYEPNLFGAYTGCCAVLFLSCYLLEGRRLSHLLCFLVAAIASVTSFSRAALLALVATSCWVVWRGRSKNPIDPKKLLIFATAFGLITSLAFTSVGGVLRERFTNLFYEGLTEETAISRVVVIGEALQDLPGHLLLGNGTASFNLSFDWAGFIPQWAGEAAWIGNAPLRVLHDTGILGLSTMVGFFVMAWRKVRRIKTNGVPLGFEGLLVALQAGILLYAVCFQSTDGTIEAFFWVHLAVFASAVILLSSAAQDTSSLDRAIHTH